MSGSTHCSEHVGVLDTECFCGVIDTNMHVSTNSLLPIPFHRSPSLLPPLPSPPLQSIKQLAHSLSAEHCLDSSSLVTIYWPEDKCPLLKEDVVLVDRFVHVCMCARVCMCMHYSPLLMCG